MSSEDNAPHTDERELLMQARSGAARVLQQLGSDREDLQRHLERCESDGLRQGLDAVDATTAAVGRVSDLLARR